MNLTIVFVIVFIIVLIVIALDSCLDLDFGELWGCYSIE